MSDGVFLREHFVPVKEFTDSACCGCLYVNPTVPKSRCMWPKTYKLTHVRVSSLVTWEVDLGHIGGEPLRFDALDTHEMSALVRPDPEAEQLGCWRSYFPCCGRLRDWKARRRSPTRPHTPLLFKLAREARDRF